MAERDALGQVDVALDCLDGLAGFLFPAALEFQPDGVADALVGAADVAGAVEHGWPRECADGAEPAVFGGHEEVVQVRQLGSVLLAVPDANGDLPAVAVEAGKRAAAQGVTDHTGEGGGVHADGAGAVAVDEQGQLVGGLVLPLIEGDHAGDVSKERLELVGQRIELLRVLAREPDVVLFLFILFFLPLAKLLVIDFQAGDFGQFLVNLLGDFAGGDGAFPIPRKPSLKLAEPSAVKDDEPVQLVVVFPLVEFLLDLLEVLGALVEGEPAGKPERQVKRCHALLLLNREADFIEHKNGGGQEDKHEKGQVEPAFQEKAKRAVVPAVEPAEGGIVHFSQPSARGIGQPPWPSGRCGLSRGEGQVHAERDEHQRDAERGEQRHHDRQGQTHHEEAHLALHQHGWQEHDNRGEGGRGDGEANFLDALDAGLAAWQAGLIMTLDILGNHH